jgi:hypothetical protein
MGKPFLEWVARRKIIVWAASGLAPSTAKRRKIAAQGVSLGNIKAIKTEGTRKTVFNNP